MFGSDILEVAIGMIFIYLLFSLVLTGAREAIEAALKTRSADLEQGLRNLFQDPTGQNIVKAFYNHPLIYSLYHGEYKPGSAGGGPGAARDTANLPSYIPASAFALAVIDIVTKAPGGASTTPAVLAQLAEGSPAAHVIRLAMRTAGEDLDRLRVELENWYNTSMDRLSGAYRRRTQQLILVLAAVMTVALNVNTLYVARALSNQTSIRAALVAQAGKASPTGDPTGAIAALDLPIGWGPANLKVLKDRFRCETPVDTTSCAVRVGASGLELLAGWVMTAFAISLGAPFWFDTLSKVMAIRSTLKPETAASSPASPPAQVAPPPPPPPPTPPTVPVSPPPPPEAIPAPPRLDPAIIPRED